MTKNPTSPEYPKKRGKEGEMPTGKAFEGKKANC